MRNRLPAAMVLVAAALLAAACGSSSSGSGGTSGTSEPRLLQLRLEDHADKWRDRAHQRQGLHPVLVRARYQYQVERNGSCAQIWPPVKGSATAGSGVTGKLGTITRSDGSIQATYDGHPLYTYTADTAPGQANGNGINASGGVWHEVTASGAAAAASSPSASSGGGY